MYLKNLIKLSSLLTILFIATNSMAGYQTFNGTVSEVTVGPRGGVLVKLSSFKDTTLRSGVVICSIDSGYRVNSITPTVCNSWFGMILLAQSSGKHINISFDESILSNTRCYGSNLCYNNDDVFVSLQQ